MVSPVTIESQIRILSRLIQRWCLFVFIGGLTLVQAKNALAQSAQRTCVLVFERSGSPISKHIIHETFRRNDFETILEAQPVDFFECLTGNFTDIVFVAHAVQVDPKRPSYRLGYFSRVNGQEREQIVANALSFVNKEISGMQSDTKCRAQSINNKPPQGIARPCQHRLRLMKELKEKLVQNDEFSFPVYGPAIFGPPKIILPNVFQKSLEWLDGHRSTVRRIRFANCAPDAIFSAYPIFQEFHSRHGIELNFKDPNTFLSWVTGKSVVTVNMDWILGSLAGDQ